MRRLLLASIVTVLVAASVALAVHDDVTPPGRPPAPPPAPPPASSNTTGTSKPTVPAAQVADVHAGAVTLVAEALLPEVPVSVKDGSVTLAELTTDERGGFRAFVPLPETAEQRVLHVVYGDRRIAVRVPRLRADHWPADARPFADDSPWNSPIPDEPAIDEASAAMIGWLSSGDAPGVANLYNYGVPIWELEAHAVARPVPCRLVEWGTCGLAGSLIPIPDGARATDVAKDGAMVVVDRRRRRSYEFFRAQQVDGRWSTGWGGILDLGGWGVGTAESSATGSAISRLAGVVRAPEIATGRIDHALVFSTDNACRAVWRFPAAKTDGASRRDDCIPEGTRIQLDPAVDVDALDIGPGERAVARALQRYGAYAIDNGGARMAFIFEVPSGEPDPYPAAGLTEDYFGLRLPWDRLRVLREWDGS